MMLTRFLSAALATVAAPTFAATINLNSGDVITLAPNTETTVTCNGGTSGDGAFASFGCDTSTNLTIDLINAQGAEQQKSIWLGDESVCTQTASMLSARRAHVYDTTVIALCDTSTNLYRYALLRSGAINQLATTWIGDEAGCLAQAKNINGG